LETKQISKEQIESFLIAKLGQPINSSQTNLCQEFVKKVNAYYFAEETRNTSVFSLIGTVTKVNNVIEKQFKEGKNKGQIYYVLKVTSEDGEEKLQALKEHLPTDKLDQIKQLAFLGKKLVFKYKKWITNKQILDFYPMQKIKELNSQKSLKRIKK
jgi:hypothetical protein